MREKENEYAKLRAFESGCQAPREREGERERSHFRSEPIVGRSVYYAVAS